MKDKINNILMNIILLPVLVVVGFILEHLVNHAQRQSLKQENDNEIY